MGEYPGWSRCYLGGSYKRNTEERSQKRKSCDDGSRD